MQAVVNTSDMSHTNQVLGEDSYVIKIEMIDGSSQLVHLSMDQALALGLQYPNNDGTGKSAIKNTPTHLNYKIVQPADLNLCPIDTNPNAITKTTRIPQHTFLSRGRPKKRAIADKPNASETTNPNASKTIRSPKPKIVRTSRTRSGRITRPPVHMERDFEKIVTEIKPKHTMIKDVATVQFESLTTTNSDLKEPPEPVQHISLETNRKKRLIPAQYRCTMCKKAYLGRNRMARHLKKHPDHGLVNPLTMEDSETWSCLIETALKANKGQRGLKFCKEIVNLIRNARVLVKYFFKPAKLGKVEYEVDSLLANVLDINQGEYRFNENELCKDVSIFSFLFFNDDAFNPVEPDPEIGKFVHSTPVHDHEQEQVLQQEQFQFEHIEANDSTDCNKNKPLIDLHFGSVIDLPKTSKLASANHKQHEHIKNDFMHMFSEDFIEKSPNKGSKIGKDKFNLYTYSTTADSVKGNDDLFRNNLFIETEKPDKKSTFDTEHLTNNEPKGKEVDIYRNTINNILNYGASNENMSTLLDKGTKEKKIRKSDEFDLNKLHLDELMLTDAPVNNIMDTSTGSDDIMNVDQFVNERFKKLTEPEGSDLPNLDLPALECFSFNS